MTSAFIFGSCVTRDAFDPEVPELPLKHYVARQSIISAMLSHGQLEVDVSGLESASQRRMVSGDIAGDLTARIRETVGPEDVIVWDLTDERFGVLCFDSGPIVTPTQELRATSDPILEKARHVAFASTEHLALFRAAVEAFSDWLHVNGLERSVVVLETPHTGVFEAESHINIAHGVVEVDEGAVAGVSERAAAWNQQAAPYYEILSRAGFSVFPMDPSTVSIDPQHRWGVAPFHFSRRTYDSMLEKIAEFLDRRESSIRKGSHLVGAVDDAEYDREMAGIWPNGLNAERVGCAWQVTLPNGELLKLEMEGSRIDWEGSFATDVATSTLWLRSLIYLPLIERLGGSAFVDDAVRSYEVFLRKAILQPEFFRMNSLDHAIAMALASLCRLRVHRLGRGEKSACTAAEGWLPLVRLLERLARREDVYAPNNHGMFIDVAIMNSRWIWPGDNWREASLIEDIQRLESLLTNSFSPEGVTVENTPHYQAVWILLVSQALYVVKHLCLPQAEEFLSTLYPRLTQAYSVMLLPNGDIPPFGDGVRAKSPYFSSSRGELYSKGVGLYVDSRDEGYFAFKCGAASPVHKHLDDNAIYLEVDGVELVSDAGLLDYDSFNERSNLARGQLGHSSLAFRDLDHVPQSFIYPVTGAIGASCSLTRSKNEGATVLTGKASSLGAYHSERKVVISSLHDIVLEDSIWSRFGGDPVQRFLVPADAEVVSRSGVVEVARGGLKLVIEFEGSEQSDVSVGRSPVGPFYSIERSCASSRRVRSRVKLSVTGLGGGEVD